MGGRILVDYGSPTRILHVNNLGTTTVTNDQTGAELQDELFYPWGQDWTRAGQPYVMHFAGMSFESPEQLYLTDFRKYNSALGRWMTPDLLGGDVTNPQSLNRYAYVLNNPTTLTDPLGLKTCGGNGPQIPNGENALSWCRTHIWLVGGFQGGFFTNNTDEFDFMNSSVVDVSNPVWVQASNVSTVGGGGTFVGPWTPGYWEYPTVNAAEFFAGSMPAQWSFGGPTGPVNGDVPLPDQARVVLSQVYKSTRSLQSPWAPVVFYGASAGAAAFAMYAHPAAVALGVFAAGHPAVVNCATDFIYGLASPPGASSGLCGAAGQVVSGIWNSR